MFFKNEAFIILKRISYDNGEKFFPSKILRNIAVERLQCTVSNMSVKLVRSVVLKRNVIDYTRIIIVMKTNKPKRYL